MLVRTPSDLGALIRTRRRELALDQKTLAARAGVSRLWIVEFERGKPRAEIGLVLRTLAALDLHVDVVLEKTARSGASKGPAPPPPDLDAIVRAARKAR